MEVAVFVTFALLAVAFAIVVVAHPHPVKSTMSMVVVLFCLAVLFTMLGAPMIAALQVLVYTGAILVLFLFVIMLLNVGRERAPVVDRPAQRWVALVAAAFFAGFLGMLLWRTHGPDTLEPLTPDYLSIHRLSWELFTTWILPFELVGLLLLVAVVAAYVLARAPRPGEVPPAPPAEVDAAAGPKPARAAAGSHP
ncbi:MAG TPA: NADH-quinone oxidoreductase subunit J [Thermoanaerobaculia bacterium]|jgi:NADH-quinone oxidoreductase subunit J|nr:NADH-quinone oxidoreductase subunit J [Thermoanaerobaculia bacterium]